MAKRRYTTEEFSHTLREADVLLGQGKTIVETCKAIGITDHTYLRWRCAPPLTLSVRPQLASYLN